MKNYEVKIYSNTWILLGAINPRSIGWIINWNEALNWGQWDLTLDIEYIDRYASIIDVSNIVEVREVDEVNKVQTASYSGIIEEYEKVISKDGTRLEIKIYWVFTVLNDVIFDNGAWKVFTLTDTPWNIIKTIIDYFNAQYWSLWGDAKNLSGNIVRYTWDSIDATGASVSINFNYNTCKEAIETVLENTNLKWYIGQDGVCYVQPKPSNANQRFDFSKDIQIFKVKKTKRNMANKVYLERSGWTIVQYQDSTAISTYRLKEKKETNSAINDLATQNTKWGQYITDHKDWEFEIEMTVNPMRSIDIKPWDVVKTRNWETNYDLLEIVKIDKNEAFFTLYFQNIQSFGEAIKSVV